MYKIFVNGVMEGGIFEMGNGELTESEVKVENFLEIFEF